MRSPNVVGALETLYGHHEGDLQAWAESVVEAAYPLLEEGGMVDLVVSRPGHSLAMAFAGTEPGQAEAARQLFQDNVSSDLTPDEYQATMHHPQLVARWSEVAGPASFGAAMLEIGQCVDILGLTTQPTSDVAAIVGTMMKTERTVSSQERSDLTRVALHVEAAVRARLQPDAVIGTLTPQGRLELGTTVPTRTERDQLAAQVGHVESLRTRAHRSDGDRALAVWKALVAGHLSLLERVDTDGKRLYDLYENPSWRRPLRALGVNEEHVVTEALRGLANKEIAFALGLGESYVSRLLGTAARKLGLPGGRALLQLAARLGRSAELDAASLTAAEREVLGLVAEGRSNAQIAAERGVAPRTVANQVASVLAKTGARSRRGLLGS